MVRAYTVHGKTLSAAPDVAGSHDDRDLHAVLKAFADDRSDLLDLLVVDNAVAAGKSLAGQLQQHSFVRYAHIKLRFFEKIFHGISMP